MNEQFLDELKGFLCETHGRIMPFASPAEMLAEIVAIAKDEVKEDVRDGTVPYDVKDFAALHDFVDANGYGGAFDWPCLPGEDRDDGYQEAFCAFWNEVQGSVSEWIASGAMRDELALGRT